MPSPSVPLDEADAVGLVVVGGELKQVRVLVGLHPVAQARRQGEGHAGQQDDAVRGGQVVAGAEADAESASVEGEDLVLDPVVVPGAALAPLEVQQLAAVGLVDDPLALGDEDAGTLETCYIFPLH